MMWIDIIGHIGYIFLFLGMVALGQRHVIGWLLRLTGEVIWLGLGVALGLTSIWIWGFVFVVADAYGFLRWRQEIDDE